MYATEIREFQKKFMQGVTSGELAKESSQGMICIWASEIAAQLAELNAMLRKVSDGDRLCVDTRNE